MFGGGAIFLAAAAATATTQENNYCTRGLLSSVVQRPLSVTGRLWLMKNIIHQLMHGGGKNNVSSLVGRNASRPVAEMYFQ